MIRLLLGLGAALFIFTIASATGASPACATVASSMAVAPNNESFDSSRYFEEAWYKGIIFHTQHRSGKVVALTFDDGPSPTFTPQVLAILQHYHIHATFCMVGDNARQHPDLVRQVVAAGDRLCDHTMTHDERLPGKSDADIRAEIVGTLNLLEQISPGTPVYYFRPPGGALSQHEIDMVKGWGLTTLYWSADSEDWKRPGVNSILANIHHDLRSGGVILMHDGGGDRRETLAALQILIPELIAQGYTFDFPAH